MFLVGRVFFVYGDVAGGITKKRTHTFKPYTCTRIYGEAKEKISKVL